MPISERAKEIKKAQQRFANAARIEKEYSSDLLHIAKNVDRIIKSKGVDDLSDTHKIETSLNNYADLLDKWANAKAESIYALIDNRGRRAWIELSRTIGLELRRELLNAPTGRIFAEFRERQVELIKSLPLDAGKRVHSIVLDAMAQGKRFEHIEKDILETGKITANRARLIARTEVATAASVLVEARSKYIGSTKYYWRTAKDADVRESHKAMDGKICEWSNPPEVDPGKYYHAGQFPNCRCHPEPIIDNH